MTQLPKNIMPPTPEQVAMYQIEVLETARAGQHVLKRVNQTPLDCYLSQRLITQRQYDAGRYLTKLYEVINGSLVRTSDYTPRVSGRHQEWDEYKISCESLIKDCWKQLKRQMPILYAIVVQEQLAADYCAQNGYKPRSGIDLAKHCLDCLADFFKFPDEP